MADETSEPAKTARPHYLAWSVAGVLFGLLVAAGAWWYVGGRVWTDGRTVRVSAGRADPREVLWTPPAGLGEMFNTADQEYEPSLSPDGTELYFVRGKAARNAEIFVSYRRNNRWTEPAALPGVNGPNDDLGPRLTPDGRFLLFYSDRPGGQGGFDLWASARGDDGGWGEPFNLGPSVNTEFNEYSPAPTPDGKRLYFASNRKAAGREQKEAWRATIRADANGDYDLFVAVLDEAPPLFPLPPGEGQGEGALEDLEVSTATPPQTVAGTQPVADTQPVPGTDAVASTQPAAPPHPAPLPGAEGEMRIAYRAAAEVPGVNTPFHEGASCVSTVGDFLYFASNRPGGLGKFDIYRCRLRDDGTLAVPENLGPQVNTAENEADPALAVGGFHLFFSSDRDGAEARGGYDLLSAESREVYALRQGRPLPALGWSWWVLLGSVLLLIPLVKYLRGWNDHKLNVLQKCLLVSLLLHVLLTLSLSFVAVTHEVMQLAKQDAGLGGMGEVAVVGDGGSGLDIAMAIRGGGAGGPGMEVAAAEPPAVEQRAASAPEAFSPPDVLDVGVPRASAAEVAAGRMTVAEAPPAALRQAVPANTSDRVTVAPDGPELAAPQVALSLQAPVSETEKTAPVAPAAADAVAEKTAVPGAAAGATPQPVQIALEPAKLTGAGAFLSGAVAAPAGAGSVAASRAGAFKAEAFRPATDLADVSAPVAVDGPSAAGAGQRVADAGGAGSLSAAAAEPGAVGSGVAGLARQAVEAGGGAGSGAGAPAAVELGVPGTSNPGPSLAVAAAVPGGRAGGAASGASGNGASAASVPSVKVDPAAAAGTGSLDGVGPAQAVAAGNAPRGVAEAAPAITATEQEVAPRRAAVAAGGVQGEGGSGGGAAAVAVQPGASGAPPARPGAGATGALGGLAPSTRPTLAGVGTAGDGAAAGPPRVGPENVAGPAALGAVASAGSAGPVSEKEATAVAGAAGSGAGVEPTVAVAKQDTDGLGRAGGPDALSAVGAGAGEKTGIAPAGAPSSESLAAAAPVGARPVVPQGQPGVAGAAGAGAPSASLPGPQLELSLAKPGAAKASAPPTAGGGDSSPLSGDDALVASGRLAPSAGSAAPGAILSSTSGLNTPAVPGAKPRPSQSILSRGAALQPRAGDVAAVPLNLEVAITSPTLAVPEPMQHRSVEARRPLLERMGGTKQSEDAVGRALAYLARQQESDGRWTYVDDDNESRPGRRGRGSHDMALTGLATLAFLAADHTPARAGPYKDVVTAGVDFLLAQQRANGDLRGPRPGGGADAGNLYDQGIATLALAESGLMTGDRRVIDAALKGAEFIVKAQDRNSGGWRYLPGEYGDTSVFGWQIMALHSAQQLGFAVPPACRARSLHYVQLASQGGSGALAGYQPGQHPTAPMTAELLFCRILLGDELTAEAEREASDFLTRQIPSSRNADFYCWYYGSLSLMQLQNDAWKKWNERTRETLVRMQKKGGADDGAWDARVQWGDRGGRVYSTALGALTLEVYYRYLPLSEQRGNSASSQPATTTPARPDIGYLAR